MNLRYPPVIVCAKANQMVYTMGTSEMERVKCTATFPCCIVTKPKQESVNLCAVG